MKFPAFEAIELEEQGSIKELNPDELVTGKYQPRMTFDNAALESLAASIKARGLLQPILARQTDLGYEIIAGERRWRAAQIAGLETIPVIVRNIPDESAIAVALVENIQRENLNPIEEAHALKRLIEEFSMTHEQVAHAIGRSRTAVTNLLRLLKLAMPVQDLLMEGKLDVGHVKVLLSFTPDEQEEIATRLVEQDLTVRAAEQLVRAKRRGDSCNEKLKVSPHPKTVQWETLLKNRFSCGVTVKVDEAGKGKIVLNVGSIEEMRWLIENL